jgi:Ricin-type beta-trefoil lectin domain
MIASANTRSAACARFRGRRWLAVGVLVVALCSPLFTAATAHAFAGTYHELQNLAGGKCLWSPNTTVGTTVEQYTCQSSWAPEEWNFIYNQDTTRYILQNRNSLLCVDEYGDRQSNGTQDIQYPCNFDDPAQVVVLGAYGNKGCAGSEASLIIWNASGNKLRLDDYRASTANYAPTDFWQQNSSNAQSWCLRY